MTQQHRLKIKKNIFPNNEKVNQKEFNEMFEKKLKVDLLINEMIEMAEKFLITIDDYKKVIDNLNEKDNQINKKILKEKERVMFNHSCGVYKKDWARKRRRGNHEEEF